MPEIARFYGLTIYMYYGDHAPPHFHVKHGRAKVAIALADGRILGGEIPPTGLRMARRWILARQAELNDNWQRAAAHLPLEMIPGPDGRE